MFRVTVLSEKLQSATSLASHAISSRSQLPILLNFLLEAKDGNLEISSTDLETGVIVRIPAKIEEEGKITVPAKTFLDFISTIDREKIELELKETTLDLKADGITASFPTLSADEFPKLYEQKGELVMQFSKKEFEEEISRIVFVAAQDIGRPALSGVLIKKDGEDLTVVATDGYRLSLKKGFSAGKVKKTEAQSFLIPGRVIKELLGGKSEDTIDMYSSNDSNQVLFETPGVTIIGRLIEAEYPNYQKIIPTEATTSAVFDRVAAQAAVRASSVFAREGANIIKMSVLKDKITFSTSASSAGKNEIEIEAKTTGEENEIAFNAKYLLDFFSNVSVENILFEMTGPLNPGVFKLPEDKGFLHIIMPIRIQE